MPTRVPAALARTALAALLAAAAAPACPQTVAGTAHDLSLSSATLGTNGATGIRSTTETQICIFCHTPHRASAQVLLWNHAASAYSTYSWGTDDVGQPITSTTWGTPLPSTPRPESRRCLGCHDGSVALGSVSSLATPIPMTVVAGKTDATGHLVDPAEVVGGGGDMGGQHPVSIPYAGQAGYNGISSGVPASKVDNAPGHYWMVKVGGCETQTGICTQATGAPLNGSRIQLIPNVQGGTANVGVECTTCHEPHGRYGLAYFMRVDPMTQDALCRSCHNK
jgi:predicted CXXCH cytochrome family protein